MLLPYINIGYPSSKWSKIKSHYFYTDSNSHKIIAKVQTLQSHINAEDTDVAKITSFVWQENKVFPEESEVKKKERKNAFPDAFFSAVVEVNQKQNVKKKTNGTWLNSLYNILSAFRNSIYRFLPNKLQEKRKLEGDADQSGHFNPTEWTDVFRINNSAAQMQYFPNSFCLFHCSAFLFAALFFTLKNNHQFFLLFPFFEFIIEEEKFHPYTRRNLY